MAVTSNKCYNCKHDVIITENMRDTYGKKYIKKFDYFYNLPFYHILFILLFYFKYTYIVYRSTSVYLSRFDDIYCSNTLCNYNFNN